MLQPVPHLPAPACTPLNNVLPQNIEAEAALLGAMIIDNRLCEDVQVSLARGAFLRAVALLMLMRRSCASSTRT